MLAAATMPAPVTGPDLRGLIRNVLDSTPVAVMPKLVVKQAGSVPYLHPAALLLTLVATAWFQAVHAAEITPGAKHSDAGPAGDVPPNAPGPLDHAEAAVASDQYSGGAAVCKSDWTNQSFQQMLAAAFVLLSVIDSAVSLTQAPAATEAAPDLTAAATASHPHGAAHAPDPLPDGFDAAAATANHDAAALAAPAPSLDAAAADDPAQPLQTVHLASPMPFTGSLNGLADAAPTGGLPGDHTADHGAAELAQSGQALSANDGSNWGQAGANGNSLPEGSSAWAGATADLGTNTNAASHLVLQPHISTESIASPPSEALVTWSLIGADHSILSFDALPTDLEHKITAVVPTLAIHEPQSDAASTSVVAAPGSGDGQVSSAASAAVASPAATTAAATDTAPHQAPVVAAPVQSNVLPATVALVSEDGVHAAQTHQVSLNDALVQLENFILSTPAHLTIQVASSLMLIDQAVLADPQVPHVMESFGLPDGSEIGWVQLVGVTHPTGHA
nr:hypothetical protein [uncultured Rhodopila sp.]